MALRPICQAEDGSCNGGKCKPGMGCEAGYNSGVTFVQRKQSFARTVSLTLAGTECDPSACDRAESDAQDAKLNDSRAVDLRCKIDPSFVSQALDLVSVKANLFPLGNRVETCCLRPSLAGGIYGL